MDGKENSLTLKVLLIEDSPLLREILINMLEDMQGVKICGYAEDEKQALALLASQPIDLAIVDIELKQGSGVGVLRAIQADPARYGTPRTVVLSNHSHPAMRHRCEKLGIDAFFDKSLQMAQLVHYIENAVPAGTN